MADTKKSPTNFTFEHGGETYEFEHSFAVVATPKFLRAHRRRDQLDLTFTILEEVAGEKALEVIDEMNADEFAELSAGIEQGIADALAAK